MLHGTPARRALEACLDEHQRPDRLAPATVVVRSALAGLDLRRRLAAPSGLVNVRFTVLSRVAELIGAPELSRDAPVGCGRRPITRAALGAALRAALDKDPGVLAPASTHTSTEAALADSYGDLRQAVGAERSRLAGCGARVADVVRLADCARQLLVGGWYDVDDLTSAATAALRAGRGVLEDLGLVVVHLPDLLRPVEIDLLVALSNRAPLRILVGVTGDEQADAAPLVLARLLAERLGVGAPPAVAGRAAGAVRVDEVVSAPDPETEVREAIRRVIAHGERGRSFARCAIVHPGSRRYGRLLAEQLDAAGLAWNGPAPDVARGLARGACPHRSRGAGKAAAGARALRDRRLARPGSDRDGRRRSGALRGLGPRVASRRRGLRSCGVARAARRVRRALRGGSPSRVGAGARSPRVRRGARGRAVANSSAAARGRSSGAGRAPCVEEYLAPPDSDVHREVELAIEELIDLEPLEALGSLAPSLRHDRMSRALASVLDRPAPRVGRYGRGVVVAPLASLVGLETELLVVVGATEGQLPGRTSDDPLLPAHERERADAPALVRERVEASDRRHLVALLRAADRAIVTTPRLDQRDGRPTLPSPWLDGDLASGALETTISSFAASLSV